MEAWGQFTTKTEKAWKEHLGSAFTQADYDKWQDASWGVIHDLLKQQPRAERRAIWHAIREATAAEEANPELRPLQGASPAWPRAADQREPGDSPRVHDPGSHGIGGTSDPPMLLLRYRGHERERIDAEASSPGRDGVLYGSASEVAWGGHNCTRHWGPYHDPDESWVTFKHITGERPTECPYGCCILGEMQWSGIFREIHNYPLAIKGWFWGIDGEEYHPTVWIRGIPQLRPRAPGHRYLTHQPEGERCLRMSIACHYFMKLASDGAPIEELWQWYDRVEPEQINRCTWWMLTAIFEKQGWSAHEVATDSFWDAMPARSDSTVRGYLQKISQEKFLVPHFHSLDRNIKVA